MARLRGRCPAPQRLTCYQPGGHWSATTMLGAIRLAGPFAGAVVKGATDSDVFRTYIAQALCPALLPGDVVVMDNLPPHKAAGVREAIEAVGASLLYLPPYSPDFSPIEPMWSKVKQHLRSAAARTFETLCQAVTEAFAAVTTDDCSGYFRHCGYATWK